MAEAFSWVRWGVSKILVEIHPQDKQDNADLEPLETKNGGHFGPPS
jgi:hypothetical protein